MSKLLYSLLPVVMGIGFFATAPKAQAAINFEVGVEPVCPYGYYDAPPYYCAPYGYYGPEWFQDGIFIGAGPWYHGGDRFWGRVDRDYDHDHYRGHFPARNEGREHSLNRIEHFHGNQHRDGRGHERR